MKSTIQFKINITLIGMITCILIIFGFYDYFATDKSLTAELNHSADIISERLANSLVEPLWNIDEKGGCGVILCEMADKNIFAIQVRESADQVLFLGQERDTDWKIVKSAGRIDGVYIKRLKEIVKEGQKLGTVELYLSTKFKDEDLKWAIFGIIIKTLLLDICIAMAMFFFIKKIIIRPLSGVAAGLNECADYVSTAAHQVSSVSRVHAGGASQQAAAIRETFSSLENISIMAGNSARNANQADSLARSASRMVNDANVSMEKLTHSIAELSKASEETFKIVKTIDEIAFQTNILALNAAVESARTGEAGAGFSVISREVRNLALRSADAAQNTAELIQSMVKRIKDGAELMDETNTLFGHLAISNQKVQELVGEIASASNEQAHGVEQLSQSWKEIQKVVHKHAEKAEESVYTSEGMNERAMHMKGIVASLIALIDRRKTVIGEKNKAGDEQRILTDCHISQ
ncbi:MAG: methyl-accepting chemotaxis protein [bacterium]